MKSRTCECNRQILVIACVCLLLFFLASCNNSDDNLTSTGEDGQLVELSIGDTWTWGAAEGPEQRIVTQEVVDHAIVEGTPCYVIHNSMSPSPPGLIDGFITKISSETLDPITMLAKWKTNGGRIEEGSLEEESSSTSYVYSEPPYPLTVGKTWDVSETEVTKADWRENALTFEDSSRYLVEQIEEITVPAGTFRCFKIIVYRHGSDSPSDIKWLSAETKYFLVKGISLNSGEPGSESYVPPMELNSYSVSRK